MLSRLVVFVGLVGIAAAVPARFVTPSEGDALFQRFKQQYGKVYFDEHDESFRKVVFLTNLETIRAHNALNNHTYTLAMNEFGDLTFEEFHTKHTGFVEPRHKVLQPRPVAATPTTTQTSDSIDWVAKGAVTPVQNQGQCGASWAISATGAIEGAWFVAKGKLIKLSEQQLIDCSAAGQGCAGGSVATAFDWVIQNHGICSAADYPSVDHQQSTCKACTIAESISAVKDVQASEQALKAAVAQQPVSVLIEADQPAFQFYSSGVLSGACGRNVDHAVLLVGYGSLDGVGYWKVRNSWGQSWGMGGYVLISRAGDECGIEDVAMMAVV